MVVKIRRIEVMMCAAAAFIGATGSLNAESDPFTFSPFRGQINQASPGHGAQKLPKSKLFNEVYVKSAPVASRGEYKTVKEAFAHVESGGIIYITQLSSDISSDGRPLFIDRSVTIALDADLATGIDTNDLSRSAKATLNSASDGACVIIQQDKPGVAPDRRRMPRNEVTIRDIEFSPSPQAFMRNTGALNQGKNCITVEDGNVFLDNVAIAKSGKHAFEKGLVVNGGNVSTINNFQIDVSKIGIDIFGDFGQGNGLKKNPVASAHRASLTIADGLRLSFSNGQSVNAPNIDINDPAKDDDCDRARKEHSIGIYVGRSKDARGNDPAVSIGSIGAVKTTEITGFDYGVCISGGTGHWVDPLGLRVAPAAPSVVFQRTVVRKNHVGFRVESNLLLRESSVKENSQYGAVVSKGLSQYLQNSFVDNEINALIYNNAEPFFSDNMFSGTTLNIGVSVRNEAKPQFLSNTFKDLQLGASIKDAASPIFEENIFESNKDGVRVRSVSHLRFEKNTFTKNADKSDPNRGVALSIGANNQGDYFHNFIGNNETGVTFDSVGWIGQFTGNLVGFNAIAVERNGIGQLRVGGNIFSCNMSLGNIVRDRDFKQRNISKKNTPKNCTGDKQPKVCLSLREQLGLIDGECGGWR